MICLPDAALCCPMRQIFAYSSGFFGSCSTLPDDPRPAPRLVDRVEHRADRVGEQRRAGVPRLQLLVLEALPALQRVVVPRATGDVLVEVVVTGRQDVEPGALLVGDDHRVRIGELLAEPGIHHRGVERATPHVGRVPARPGPRARHRRRKHEVFRCGEQQLPPRLSRLPGRERRCRDTTRLPTPRKAKNRR